MRPTLTGEIALWKEMGWISWSNIKIEQNVKKKSKFKADKSLKLCTFIFELSFHLQFSSVQSLSNVRLFATPWIAARQASLSITISWSSLKLMTIQSVIPSSHLTLCCPLFLLPSIPPSIRVFSNESTLCISSYVLLISHFNCSLIYLVKFI